MAPEHDRAGRVAALIADSAPVDWARAAAGYGPDELELLAQLRVVADIERLHRSVPSAAAGAVPAAAAQPEAVAGSADGSVPVSEAPRTWGSFTLHEQIGKGAFGEVYLAWDPKLAREVALKLLPDNPCGDGNKASALASASAIVEEGRLLARVRHPNVVTVYGADRIDGRVGLWMEFVRGESLDAFLAARGSLSARETALVGIDLCRALSAVHHAGLVHRDVKAQNVMREQGGRTVLMDFGAGCESLQAHERGLAGTPLYVAPELLERREATIRSDLYSLGVLLYHLATGRFPVEGRSIDDIAHAHRVRRNSRLRDVRPDMPASFVEAVERALMAEPADRFATAGEMEAALLRTLIEDAPAGRRATRPPVRRPWTAAVAIGIGLATIVGALVRARRRN